VGGGGEVTEERGVGAKPVGDDEGAAGTEGRGGFLEGGVEVGEVGEALEGEGGIERGGREGVLEPVAVMRVEAGMIGNGRGLFFGVGAGVDLEVGVRLHELVGELSVSAADIGEGAAGGKVGAEGVDELGFGQGGRLAAGDPEAMVEGGSPGGPVEGIEVVVVLGGH
jgi:hypothetical protein